MRPQEEKKKMRGKILDEVREIINGERQDQYGDPEDSFSTICALWNVILYPTQIIPKDVCMMMALFKIGREIHQHKRDNLIDAIGYLALADEVKGG
jgi:hypothetical protein